MGYKVCESCGSPDLIELKKLRAEVDRLKRSRAGYIGQFNKAQVQRGELRAEVEKRCEVVSDWVSNLAMRDSGAVFWKRTKDEEAAPVTYGDLRQLMAAGAILQPDSGKGEG